LGIVIRYTFYTESDDFSYRQTVEESREWLRARGYVTSRIEEPDGTVHAGQDLDDLSDAEIGRWVASASMGIVRRKAEEAGYISFYTERGDEWVSVFADRIQAVGASVEDDQEPDARDEIEGPQWASWTDQEPRFTD
jgi:hypothetical protein